MLLDWRQLPPLPDPCGFASPFVGVSGGVLLVAGGANFPGEPLWDGGAKAWHDRIFALEPGASRWTVAGTLPAPLAYGLSVSVAGGVLCAGGSDGGSHSDAVFVMEWRDGRVICRDLPRLPSPVAMVAGVVAGDVVYLAGGLASPGSVEALTTFLAFDIRQPADGWRPLPPWPGPGRFQAVAAADGPAVYLLSGLRHEPRAAGGLAYLADAYRFDPGGGWRRLPDLPYPAAAAATPAPVGADGTLVVIGGVDGALAGTRPQDFGHVPQRIQAYMPGDDAWRAAGNAPVGRVCVSATEWQGAWVLPSGERSSGVRSPEVWALRFPPAGGAAGRPIRG
ncbi:MAG: galactose oxidase [Vicinamibacterales bacterium]